MRVLLFLIFLGVGYVGTCQDVLPRMRTFTPKDYGETQTPENWSIAEDTSGVMYFGNAGGVLSYDHVRWKFIPVKKGQWVFSLCSDPKSGAIYTGGESEFGILVHDSLGQIEYVSLSAATAINFDFGRIWRIYISGDLVFYQANEAIFVFDKTTQELTAVRATNSFHLMLQCGEDIYVRDRGLGLAKWVDNEFELVPQGEKFKLYGIFDIVPYQSQKSLIITQELGLMVLSKDSIHPLTEDSTASLRYRHIVGGIQCDSNTYLLHSLKEGVFEVDNTGKIVNLYNAESGLKSEEVKALFTDSRGNLWLATGNGITVVNRSVPLSVYTNSVGLEGNIQAIKTYQGELLVGTSVGLYRQSGDRHKFEQLQLEEQIWDLDVIHSQLIIATNNGLFVYDNERLELIHPINAEVVFYDSINQTLIVGGTNGIVVLDVINHLSVMQSFGIPLGKCMGIEKDPESESIWIGSTQAGVFKLNYDPFEGYLFENFSAENGLAEGEWIKPLIYKRSLKFGTPTELLEYSKAELSPNGDVLKGYFSEFSNHPFKKDVSFQDFAAYGSDLWYCVNNEIGHVSDTIISSLPFQGLDIGRINFLRSDTVLWIGASEGLVRYEFDAPNTITEPQLLIREITFNDSVHFRGIGSISIGALNSQINALKISLSLLSNSISDKGWYRYHLEEEGWSDWTEQPDLEIHNLGYGPHELSVMAKDQFGLTTKPHTFRFSISPPWYVQWWSLIIYVAILASLIIVAVFLGRRRLKKQNIWLEGIVQKRTAELETSYHQIKEQKEEITDSINYARRIQEAILPRGEDIENALEDYFILYKPKDIVSGDFYWFADIENNKIIVCADCTGHGVPGGFMSMIGTDKLNRKVLEEGYNSPSDILQALNIGIKQSLKQHSNQIESTKDGMDAAIISIQGDHLRYAGANRPLWIIRDKELIEIKATKSAIAGFTPDDQVYQMHEIQLQDGDAIYMTTDGYPDQFGGPKGKKFKIKQMKELLLSIADKPMHEQHDSLDKSLEAWMGNLEQIDDICVVGIRY